MSRSQTNALSIIAIILTSFLRVDYIFAKSTWKFYTKQEFEQSSPPNGYETALLATKQLPFPGMNCTGTVVSKSGHILTAFHCVRECFLGKNRDKIVAATSENIFGSAVSNWLFKIDKEKATQGLYCQIYTNKDQTHLSDNFYEVIYFNALGWLPPNVEAHQQQYNREEFLKLTSSGYNYASDFVVLKPIDSTTHEKCLKLSKTPLRTGDPLYTISFPYLTLSIPPSNFDLRMSIGNKRASVADSINLPPAELQTVIENFQRKGIFETSTPVNDGSSGSASLNMNSEIVGVNFQLIQNGQEENYQFFSQAISSEYIYSSVINDLGGDNANQIFDCN
jgi:hypothetical protein